MHSLWCNLSLRLLSSNQIFTSFLQIILPDLNFKYTKDKLKGMSSYKENIIHLTMSDKSAKIFRGIILTGIILAAIFGVITLIVATSKPDMTEMAFQFDDGEDYITVDLPADKNDKIYYRISSNTAIDVRIMTDFEGNSWTQKDYHYTSDEEFVYTVPSTDTYTIHVEYGEGPATGSLFYAISGDNKPKTTLFTVAIFISLVGGMIVALIYGGIADYVYRKNHP